MWLRFLRTDIRELDALSARLLGHRMGFVLHRGPIFVLYDPDPGRAKHRFKHERDQKKQPGPAWHTPSPGIIAVPDADLQLLPTSPDDFSYRKWRYLAPFLYWAFPGQARIITKGRSPDFKSGRMIPISLSSVHEIWQEWEDQVAPGTPLFDLSTYRLLGLSPLTSPEDAFLEWVSAQ